MPLQSEQSIINLLKHFTACETQNIGKSRFHASQYHCCDPDPVGSETFDSIRNQSFLIRILPLKLILFSIYFLVFLATVTNITPFLDDMNDKY